MPFDGLENHDNPTLSILHSARELVSQEWIQHAMAHKIHHSDGSYHHGFCVVGAVRYAYNVYYNREHPFELEAFRFGHDDVMDMVVRQLTLALPVVYRLIGKQIFTYNDTPFRRKAAIIRLFDHAIKAENRRLGLKNEAAIAHRSFF